MFKIKKIGQNTVSMGRREKMDFMQRIYQKYPTSSERGFTLIEILIAIIIISIGVFSVVAISGKSYANVSLQKHKLIALNLAREEIDIIRSIRDENWLTETGCDGTANYCIPTELNPDISYRRTGDTRDLLAGVPTDNCDWRCDIGENILDIDYINDRLTISADTDPANPGNCITTEGCDLNQDVCPTTTYRCPLYLDSNGGYQHAGTQSTPTFWRSATIEHDDVDLNGDGNNHNDFSIVSTICWQERGRWHGICVEDHLYNWAH